MGKKKRFSMLEMGNDNPKKEETATSPQPTEKRKAPRPEVKVIIEKDAFQNNLQKHKLKEQVKEIKHEKKRIEIEINESKVKAWTRIYLGGALMIYAALQLTLRFIGQQKGNVQIIEEPNLKRYIALFILGFIVQVYLSKGKHKK